MSERGRYLVGQKLSDYQIEKILRNFAHGIPAIDALGELSSGGKTTRAPNTVYRIYELTRKRLLEINYFPDPTAYAEWTNSTEELRANFPYSKTAARIEEQRERLRGSTSESVKPVLAEMIFRAENHTLPPDALFMEIKTAIRLTGPLNRPPRDVDLWHWRHNIIVWQRHIKGLRAIKHISPGHVRSVIADYEFLIDDANKRIRKMMREQKAKDGKA